MRASDGTVVNGEMTAQSTIFVSRPKVLSLMTTPAIGPLPFSAMLIVQPPPFSRLRSKVTFDIEPLDGDQVKLTVVHDDLEPGGRLVSMISQGWPRVLANLKTLLETGEPLPDSSAHVRDASAGLTKS